MAFGTKRGKLTYGRLEKRREGGVSTLVLGRGRKGMENWTCWKVSFPEKRERKRISL